MTALYLHEDAKELLAGKTLVVIGDSVERSVYKDLVCLLQENRYLTDQELRKKGEESFIGDELIYGGVKGEMKNSIDYRECRYFKADNEACCRYYFVTICYGDYVEEILQELSTEPTDIIVMNSCLWDVHRHGKKGIEKYEENLEKLVASLRRLLPDCLFIWLTTPPVHIKSKGGFLMRPGTDLVKINEVKFCNEIAREVFTNANNIDRRFRIVDLDAVFQFFEHHRAGDGVHWNERAHRRMSNMVLEEISKAFNKTVPRVLGRYDSMWNEGNRPRNEYENFNDPNQPPHWGDDYDQDMGWGPPRHGPGPDVWQNEPPPPYHDNGWDYRPMGPPGPPHPPGYPPFGPPQMRRFGPPPPHPLPPEFLPDLDDLGQARHLVEYQEECRKRKNRDENESEMSTVPEKKYRFGATSPRKTETKKDENSPKKVTYVELDGVMKKLVELNDGVVCHVVMTEKEVEIYRKEQKEKERKEKEKKEREKKEQLAREEKARIEEEKRKKALEEEKKRPPEQLKKALGVVLNLPLVSSVPSEDKKEEKETKEKSGAMSKIASKLLSFIKKPVDRIKGKEHKTSKTAETPTDEPAPATAANDSGNPSSLPTTPINRDAPAVSTITEGKLVDKVNESPVDENKSPGDDFIMKEEKPSLVEKMEVDKISDEALPIDKIPVNNLVEKLRNQPVTPINAMNVTIKEQNNPIVSTSLLNVTSKPTVSSKPIEPAKPVDTFALLSSLSSPFAKPKSALAPTSKQGNAPPGKQKPLSAAPKTKDDEEDELLSGGDGDENGSDVDESILDDNHVPVEKLAPNPTKAAVATTHRKAPQKTQNKQTKRTVVSLTQNSVSPKLPTVAKTKKNLRTPTTLDAKAALKKKKKEKKNKHPNETKEERRIRKLKKKEKKEKEKAEKEAKKKQNQVGEKLQSISTVTGNTSGNTSNLQWNVPIRPNNENRTHLKRSATWTPSYFPSYNSQPQQQQQQPVANVVQPASQRAVAQTPIVVNSSYPNQMVQQVVTTPTQPVISSGQQQLYIDEYGQTYTLEEETYVVGPTGQIQTINRNAALTTAAYLQQQQQQIQLQQQQQYATQSLMYAQHGQQQTRYL